MCQSSDSVHLELILESDEKILVRVKGELDGEPFAYTASYGPPAKIRDALYHMGQLLDGQRLP